MFQKWKISTVCFSSQSSLCWLVSASSRRIYYHYLSFHLEVFIASSIIWSPSKTSQQEQKNTQVKSKQASNSIKIYVQRLLNHPVFQLSGHRPLRHHHQHDWEEWAAFSRSTHPQTPMWFIKNACQKLWSWQEVDRHSNLRETAKK